MRMGKSRALYAIHLFLYLSPTAALFILMHITTRPSTDP